MTASKSAKKRSPAQRILDTAPSPTSANRRLGNLYEQFWISFEVSSAKLRLFRFFFFFIFAIDAWLQIAHAPRYGHADFNVSHLPFLDGILPIPTRSTMIIIYGLQTYLGLRLALGGASRFLYIALAFVFSYGYFISQLNSYQHHYLLAIALGLLACFPWPDLKSQGTQPTEEPTKEKKTTEGKKEDAANWPVRMLLVAMSVMYLFAFITKLDGEWTDGTTLRAQLSTPWLSDIVGSVGWGVAAKVTLLVELALVFLLHLRILWPLALVLGIGMHVSFEFSNLKIGLFSYFMVSLYILLIPESWLVAVGRRLLQGRAALAIATARLRTTPTLSRVVFIVSLLGTTLCLLIPLESFALLITMVAIVMVVGIDAVLHRPMDLSTAFRHLVAIACLLMITSKTDALRDYYRFWGGNERRAGNVSAAITAYEHVVEIAPDYVSGRNSLGNLYKRETRLDEALLQYEAGMAASPSHFKVHRGAAQIYHLKGMGPQALRTAELAVKLNPKDKSVLNIRNHWQRKLNPNATRP